MLDYLKELFSRWGSTTPPSRLGDPALFIHEDGSSVTTKWLVDYMRNCLMASGMEPSEASRYAGHSFRKGGAQDLHDNGFGPDTIMEAGRWKSTAHLVYHAASVADRVAVGKTFLSSSSSSNQ